MYFPGARDQLLQRDEPTLEPVSSTSTTTADLSSDTASLTSSRRSSVDSFRDKGPSMFIYSPRF